MIYSPTFFKKSAAVFTISLSLFSMSAFCDVRDDNEKLIQDFNIEMFVNKHIELMPKYLSDDIQFYNNFSQPDNYQGLKKHFEEFTEKYTKCELLPYENLLSTQDKVVTHYTQSCTDQENHVFNKKLMVISQVNGEHKISKIWVVSHDE